MEINYLPLPEPVRYADLDEGLQVPERLRAEVTDIGLPVTVEIEVAVREGAVVCEMVSLRAREGGPPVTRRCFAMYRSEHWRQPSWPTAHSSGTSLTRAGETSTRPRCLWSTVVRLLRRSKRISDNGPSRADDVGSPMSFSGRWPRFTAST